MTATSALFTFIGTSILHSSHKVSPIRPLSFNKFFLPLSLRFSRYCSSEAILDSDVSNYGADSPSTTSTHPWPEWVNFVDRLKAKGYVRLKAAISESSGGNDEGVVDYTDMNLLKVACLSFGRDRFDIFKLLPTKDIQVVVEKGCPNLFRKSVNSGKRLRAYLGLEEGEVCGSCSLRGSCDRAYILLDDSEGAARTVDLVRMLIFYALDPLVISGEVKPPGRDLIEASARKLLLKLAELGETPVDPNTPKLVTMTPQRKKQNLNSSDGGSSQHAEMKPGDWVCTKCNFMNFARNRRCLQCKAMGPEHVSRDRFEMKKGDWNCPGCSFINFASKKICLRCQEPRPLRDLEPGDWECPDCDFVNFSRNNNCKRCKRERPQQESIKLYSERIWKKPY